MSNSHDVVIVGSGPAGASAAFCLAEAGIDAVILERASLPRYKTCGGGVVRKGLRLLPFTIRDAVERECLAAEMNLHDAGLHFETKRAVPIVSMTMRDTFDDLLLSAARKAGAHIRIGCKVLDVYPQSDRLELITSEGPLSARFVIAADGAVSTVARRMKLPDNRRLIPALEYEVTVRDNLLEKFTGSARFDFGMVARGYGWVFPKKEHLSIGIFTMKRGAKLNEEFHSYLRLLGIAPALRMERHGSLVPATTRGAPFAIDRLLLVGDAAGFVDPLTGEGISSAIHSGQIAARSLVAGNLTPEAVSRAYDAEVAAEILPELRAARLLSILLYHHPAVRSLFFRLYGQSFAEVVTDIMTGERTYRGMIGNPSNYFRLLRFRTRR